MPTKIQPKLNNKEIAVFEVFPPPTDGKAGSEVAISDVAAKAFPKKGSSAKTKGNSWVRNSLRKLVKLGLLKMKGTRSGLYFRPWSSVEASKNVEGAA